jgi:hypothetical protein
VDVLRVPIALTCLLLAGCSGSSAPPPAPSPSASEAPSARPAPAGPGDVDGDGQADTVTVTSTAVNVALSGGGSVSALLVDTDVPQVAVSGLYDVDGDGRAEVFVETARGASTSFVQFYRYDGKELAEVTYDGGHVRLGIGGSVTHGEGFSCPGDGTLVERRAETLNGTAYTIRTRTFRLTGHALTLLDETSATATSLDDPRVGAAYQVDCGSVGEGGS